MDPNPAGMVCFDPQETKEIAQFKTQCDENTMNLKDTREMFQKCMDNTVCEKSIFSSQAVFWSSVAASFVLGFIAAEAR